MRRRCSLQWTQTGAAVLPLVCTDFRRGTVGGAARDGEEHYDGCKTETELEIPDKEDSKNIHTKCSNPMCARKSNHRRTLWFKTRSIFAHTYKPIALVLLVIFCFVGLLDAQHTARECGMCEADMERGHTRHDPRNIAHDTVSKLFARMRNAVTWWGDNHHRYVCVYVCVCV